MKNWCVRLAWLLACMTAVSAQSYNVRTVAGSDVNNGDGGPAAEASFSFPEGIAIDAAGSIYIADSGAHRIRRINPSGDIETIAGDGSPGFLGDGGAARDSRLNKPYGLALDGSGNLYIADLGNARVRRISPDGRIETVAGGGTIPPGGDGDGGPAIAAQLKEPRNVTASPDGTLYVSDFAAHRVYRVDTRGTLTTVAGTGEAGFSGDGGPAIKAQLSSPAELAMDRNGALYIADSRNWRVRRVQGGTIASVRVNDMQGAPVRLYAVMGIALDSEGALFIADDRGNQTLKISPAGIVSYLPIGSRNLAVSGAGELYTVAGQTLQRLLPDGTVHIVAGQNSFARNGDGGPALEARLTGPSALAIDPDRNIYIADRMNNRLRKIDSSGVITTIAGTGERAYKGNGGPAELSALSLPSGLCLDSAGMLFVSDTDNHVIRAIDKAGVIRTVAGGGEPGFAGDQGSATNALLTSPRGLAVDPLGRLLIADSGNHRIRRIGEDGRITTIAGTGIAGFSGDGGAAAEAQLTAPAAIAVDSTGAVFVADTGNHRIRRIAPNGIIETLINGEVADLNLPTAIAIGPEGRLWIADAGNHVIRVWKPDGSLETAAGTGEPGFNGEEGPGNRMRLSAPSGIVVAPDGVVLFSDSSNHRIRTLTPASETGPIEPEPLGQIRAVNAASLREGPVTPGEIVSILDGPALPAPRVTFDGTPAQVLFASTGVLQVLVPDLGGRSETEITLSDGEFPVASLTLEVAGSAPGIFTVSGGSGPASATNEDGSQNSASNPAPRGSILTLYATGTSPSDKTPQVRVAGLPAEILFAGPAPGFSGLFQINLRLPAGYVPSGEVPVTLTSAGVASQPGVVVYLK
ncbi:MAG: hypothetical protein HUU41_09780 [Bryobacteraceae bacterium]|nr:hypothetical protein [Bryobacterales bacterium]NUN01392.1 hypothetical protein [Bryobacteraceae bacterium]